MKSRIIITISFVAFTIAIGALFYWQEGSIDIPPSPPFEKDALTCPGVPLSFTRETEFKRLFGFAIPVFATPPIQAIQSRLCFLEKPSLNTPITLLYKFKSERAFPSIIAKIKLPENFVLVSGSADWRGNLTQNEEQSFKIIVKPVKVGNYIIDGILYIDNDGDKVIADMDVINVEIPTSGRL